MCYESGWYRKQQETDKAKQAERDTEKVIERARQESRKPTTPAGGAAAPVTQREELPA